MVSHGARERERTLALGRSNALVQGWPGQAVVHIGEAHQRPGEYREYKCVDSCAPGRHHPRDISVGNECVFQNSVIAARGAHAENVPGFLDDVTAVIARHERVDDLRMLRVARVHSVQAETRPHRRQAAKLLATGEAIAALHALCLLVAAQYWHSIHAPRLASVEDLASTSL